MPNSNLWFSKVLTDRQLGVHRTTLLYNLKLGLISKVLIQNSVQRAPRNAPVASRLGMARHWGEEPSLAGGTSGQGAASRRCLLRLCPRPAAGTARAALRLGGICLTEVQVAPCQAPIELGSMILTGPFQLEILYDCRCSCPRLPSQVLCCRETCWVVLGRGRWPS